MFESIDRLLHCNFGYSVLDSSVVCDFPLPVRDYFFII